MESNILGYSKNNQDHPKGEEMKITYDDLPADLVLNAARDKLSSVLVLGYDKGGNEYFASSMAEENSIIHLLDQLKADLKEGKFL